MRPVKEAQFLGFFGGGGMGLVWGQGNSPLSTIALICLFVWAFFCVGLCVCVCLS